MPKISLRNLLEDEQCFNEFMEKMNRNLVSEHILLANRPLNLALKLNNELEEGYSYLPICKPLQEVDPLEVFFYQKIEYWFSTLDNTATRNILPYLTLPIIIKNEPRGLRLPQTYGSSLLIFNPFGGSNDSEINIAKYIVGLSENHLFSIPKLDILEILEIAAKAYCLIGFLNKIKSPLAQISLDNFNAATTLILAGSYNEASWNMQMACESLLKSFIDDGTNDKQLKSLGHNLIKIRLTIESKLNISIPTELITPCFFSAESRYKVGTSDLKRSIIACHSYIKLVAFLNGNI